MIALIDLFAGAGGLGLGAIASGGRICLSVEIDSVSCETLRTNTSNRSGVVLEADVRDLDGLQLRKHAGLERTDPLVIIGGAPCQPFSKAAYWTDSGDESRYRRARAKGIKVKRPTRIIKAKPDDRRSLIEDFWRLVHEANADGFVFENVPSILHPRNRKVFDEFRAAFELQGYHTKLVKANAAEFGVPQARRRIFLLGVRDCNEIGEPSPTHCVSNSSSTRLRPAVTAGDAISKFDKDKHFEPEEVVTGRWAEHLREVPPGWNYKHHTSWAGHPNPTFETETKFWSFLLKLSPDLVSWTIAASPGPWVGPFHWNSRRLRTIEMAALQGFPESYKFSGTRRERIRQIGNAVPPPLGKAMVSTVLDAVSRTRKTAKVSA